jgi:excisionase family DNA binding protein
MELCLEEEARMNKDESMELITVRELMASCSVGRTFIYEEIKKGRLRRLKVGRLTRFRRADVEAWLATHNTSVC